MKITVKEIVRITDKCTLKDMISIKLLTYLVLLVHGGT